MQRIKICGPCFNSGKQTFRMWTAWSTFAQFSNLRRFHHDILIAILFVRVIYAMLITLEGPLEPILKHLFFYSELKSMFLLVLTFGGHQGVDFLFELIAPVIDDKVLPRIRTVLLHSFVFVHGNAWRFCLPVMKNSHLDEMSNAILIYQANLSE